MAFGSLVPGMQPMPISQMQPNQMMKQGMQALQMARGKSDGGQPQQGLLQRLLNPAAPPPTDLAAPGMSANIGSIPGPGGNPMQMGLLAKLFPALMGGPQTQPMGGGAGVGAMTSGAPSDALGGLY